MRDRPGPIAAATCVLVLLTATARAQLPSFGDDTFAPGGPGCPADQTKPASGHDLAGYTLVKDVRFGTDGYTCITQRTDAGNPAPSAQIIIRPSIEPTTGQIIACMMKDDAVYDPAVSGAFGSIAYHEDGICFGEGSQCMSTGVCIVQDGTLYFARADFVPETTWTQHLLGAGPDDFSRLSSSGPAKPDFSATALPLQFGFYRAKSGGPGEETGIDNWRIDLLPPCATDADCDEGDACTTDTCDAGVCRRTPIDCDDGDACTTDACAGGVCASTPLVCDDGSDCTTDSCVGGVCQSVFDTDIATLDARLTALLATLEASPCGAEPIVKRVLKKLKKRLKKARKRLRRADRASAERKIGKQLGKASSLLDKAQAFVVVAVGRGLVSAACGDTLTQLVVDARACLDDLLP